MKNIFTLIFLVCSYALQSQSFIRETRYNQDISITYGNPAAKDADEIIRRLADGNNKHPRSVAYRIETVQTLIINSKEPRIIYRVESSPLRINGDNRYRGFDVTGYLFPREMKFTLRLGRKDAPELNLVLNAAINDGNPETVSTNNSDSAIVNSTSLVNHVFTYGNPGLKAFNDHADLIDNYYNQIKKVDDGFKLLQSVVPEDYDHYKFSLSRISESEKIYAETENLKLKEKLNLSSNDPGNLLQKLKIYSDALHLKKSAMAMVMSTLHLYFYDRGIQMLQIKNYHAARDYFHWALEVNPAFAPALLSLAKTDYRQGDLYEATCKSEDVLFNMNPDPDTRRATHELLGDIYLSRIDKANDLTKKKKFKDALRDLDEAERICKKHPQVKCSDDLTLAFRQAHLGIYNSILDLSRARLNANDYNGAEDRIDEAMAYQQNHASELSGVTAAAEMLKIVKQKRYDQYMLKAADYTSKLYYAGALKEMAKADSLVRHFDVKRDPSHITTATSVARLRILQLFQETESSINKNELAEARIYSKEFTEIQQHYGLTADKELNTRKESIRKNLYTRQCINAQSEIDQNLLQGIDATQQRFYLEAEEFFEKSAKLAKENSDCDLDLQKTDSASSSIRPAVIYLKLMAECKRLQDNGDYRQSLDTYTKAGNYFQEASVVQFGLGHQKDIFRHIHDNGSNGLINFSALEYASNNELDKSLILFKLLLTRGYDPKSIGGSLYDLGYKTGVRDQKENPGGSAKKLAVKYTNSDKKMKRFLKGYVKGYKS